ncbi:MAG: PRC-barrel domain-containing protein [Chloroflexota bacterium]|nr:PRC-barrel domain-containing protein [Chloroflexota bacterium]
MDESWGIPIGTDVYTVDGEHLGSVVDGDAYELVVERGFFFIHDYQIQLSDVDRFEDGKLFLVLTREQIEQERKKS